ncbi:hypothetical protein GH5_03971 [Leishmania sp. Ghana 2012 LV757]|uniref:hypothetical protein n=1 Tax=Leishmania sp. Ghana 2012 LV757 TaxID=2803181 RepID=UPI001B6EEEE8|nr:hypothetical protein GH5_03971 [Leishmania sp. Ghana 2012 LV757]
MRQRVGSAAPALAVTGKGLSEGSTQSRRAAKSPAEAAGYIGGGSAAEEKCAERHKRQPLEKKAAARDRSPGQRGRALGRQMRDITPLSTRVSSCHSASHQRAPQFPQPSRQTAVEVSLVHNLKKQVACLEAQLRVLKQQKDTMAHAHRHSNADHEGEPGSPVPALATACLTGVELPLPHARRIRHADAAVPSVTATDPDGTAIERMRRIPAAYQTERSALLHNVESLTKDVEGLQKLVLHLGRERDLMAAEVVGFRAALREMKVEHDAMAAECAATHRLLATEQALRRAAEENGKQSTTVASSHKNVMTTADAVSQRNYYKLQAERGAEALALAKTRIDTLSKALHGEREAAKTLETQLCGALDRIALMERREDELALYYQQLSGRFVTVSATLRHVLDVVPSELLQQQRAPSPECVPSGPSEAAEMTMSKLRDMLDVWHREVETEARAAKRQDTAEAITDGAVKVFDDVTATTTAEVSGVFDVPPVEGDEATVTVPRPRMEAALQSKRLSPPLPDAFSGDDAVAQSPVVSPASATDNAALGITRTLTAAPPFSAWATETPLAHPWPTAFTSIEGAGDAGPPTCGAEKGHGGFEASAALPKELYGARDVATTQLPLLPVPVPEPVMTLGSALTDDLVPSTQDAQDARDNGAGGSVPAKPDGSNSLREPDLASVLPPSTTPVAVDAPVLEPATLHNSVQVYAAARPLAEKGGGTEHVAFGLVESLTSKQTAELTENPVAVHTVEGNVVDGTGAPLSCADMLRVSPVTEAPSGATRLPKTPTTLHAIPTVQGGSDGGPIVVLSSVPPRSDGEEASASHLPPPLCFAATPTPAQPPALRPALDAANQSEARPVELQSAGPGAPPPAENDEAPAKEAHVKTSAEAEVTATDEAVQALEVAAFPVPPPPAVAVPPPPPPSLVSVPHPPAIPAAPTALVPPSLDEQLVELNARIDAQEAALVEMVRKHRGL